MFEKSKIMSNLIIKHMYETLQKKKIFKLESHKHIKTFLNL